MSWNICNIDLTLRTDGERYQARFTRELRIGGNLASHVEDMQKELQEHPDAEFDNRDPMYFRISWWEDVAVDFPLVVNHLEEEEALKAFGSTNGVASLRTQQEESAIDFLRRHRPEVLK